MAHREDDAPLPPLPSLPGAASAAEESHAQLVIPAVRRSADNRPDPLAKTVQQSDPAKPATRTFVKPATEGYRRTASGLQGSTPEARQGSGGHARIGTGRVVRDPTPLRNDSLPPLPAGARPGSGAHARPAVGSGTGRLVRAAATGKPPVYDFDEAEDDAPRVSTASTPRPTDRHKADDEDFERETRRATMTLRADLRAYNRSLRAVGAGIMLAMGSVFAAHFIGYGFETAGIWGYLAFALHALASGFIVYQKRLGHIVSMLIIAGGGIGLAYLLAPLFGNALSMGVVGIAIGYVLASVTVSFAADVDR